MSNLFKIENGKLIKAQSRALSKENLIRDWVESDPNLLGLDAMIIGREVLTAQQKKIDLLALDRSGGLIVIELKKNRTPRDIVAQILDYGSWASVLNTPEIYEIAERYLGKRLSTGFREFFGEPIPERLNGTHSLLIVASELDAASERIVEYLSEEYGVAINTAFFNVFEADGKEWLTTDFLLDQSEVEERSERKVRPPWTGYYFANAGLDNNRSWNDYRQYGFVAAGNGDFYSKRLDQLRVGNPVFLYDKGNGYIGYGIVASEKILAAEFETSEGLLSEQPLEHPGLMHDADDPEIAEYLVGIDWKKTFEVNQAKTFKGAFANQNIVCKLRDPATIDFLVQEFDVNSLSE